MIFVTTFKGIFIIIFYQPHSPQSQPPTNAYKPSLRVHILNINILRRNPNEQKSPRYGRLGSRP